MGMWLLCAAGHSDLFWKLSAGKFDGPEVGAPKLTPVFKHD